MKTRLMVSLALCSAIVVGSLSVGGGAMSQEAGSLDTQYRKAAEKYDVPVSVLKGIGYTNTRWEMPSPQASGFEHAVPGEGEPESRGAYGLMGLYENPSKDTLGKASSLTGLSEEDLKNEREANIEGAAAVLSEMHGGEPRKLNDWYKTVAEYGDGILYANQVYETVNSGASLTISTSETVVLREHPKAQTQSVASAQATGEYSGSTWYGASSSNYTPANRGATQINYIVIHVTQGSWAGSLNWFTNPQAGSSAHYTVRSSDGAIGQSVREKDIAWHAGNWNYNQQSIGIEHEGYVTQSAWFTDAMYRSSARLSAHLAKKYGIPIDRQHIIGHIEVPGSTHTDPGNYWNWTKYMSYVREYAGVRSPSPAPKPAPSPSPSPSPSTYRQVVDNKGTSRFTASSDWNFSNWNEERFSWNYRTAKPKTVRDPAKYKFAVPARDKYAVKAWWPSNSGYNTRVPVRVRTTSGWKLHWVNQSRNGGKWVHLGIYEMTGRDEVKINVSRRTNAPGPIMADAFKLVRK